MPATVMIGKKEYPLAPLVFDQMERAWPFLKQHSDNLKLTDEQLDALSQDDLAKQEMQASRDGISIIAIALESTDLTGTPIHVAMPQPPVDATQEASYDELMRKATAQRAFLIRKNMLAGEIPMMRNSIMGLLEDSGLVDAGKVSAEVDVFLASLRDQNNLTETSMNSSASSSPQELKAEAGAE
jgi:hypothetical protein